jgi:hypothetical protein
LVVMNAEDQSKMKKKGNSLIILIKLTKMVS